MGVAPPGVVLAGVDFILQQEAGSCHSGPQAQGPGDASAAGLVGARLPLPWRPLPWRPRISSKNGAFAGCYNRGSRCCNSAAVLQVQTGPRGPPKPCGKYFKDDRGFFLFFVFNFFNLKLQLAYSVISQVYSTVSRHL